MTNAASIPEAQSAGSLEIGASLGNFFEEYGEIATILPVLVGLFVTNRLQLRGAQALLVNLTIAALTRQVVIQLKKQAQQKKPEVTTVNGQSTLTVTSSVVEDYTIIHSTPGRLRLRIPRLLNDSIYAKRLEQMLLADPRVLKVRMNRAAASIVIHYDGAGVSELELGMGLLQILEKAEQETRPESNQEEREF